MRFELFVALRYLLSPRKQAFISVISLISVVAVAVGVAAVIIALALMTGLQGELRDKILGSTSHIYVFKSPSIEDYRAEVKRLGSRPGVVGAAPAILGQALDLDRPCRRAHQDQGHRPGPGADGHRPRAVDAERLVDRARRRT